MKDARKVIVLALLIKVGIFLIIFCSFSLLPFNKNMHNVNFVDPDYSKISLASAFMTWDSQHYLYLSDYGYHPLQQSNAFYPLFPGIIHITTFSFLNSFWGGIIISNVISFCAILLFYFFVKKYFSEKTAWIATVLLFAFPTAFYLSLIYSEGLFLFLTLGFFWFLFKKEFFIAGLFSVFLPLTRPVGIGIVFPFAICLIQDSIKTKTYTKLFHVLWPFVGFGLLLLFYWYKTGSAYEPFLAQKSFVGQWNIQNIFNPFIFIKSFFAFPLAIHGFTNSAIDRIFFVMYLCGIPLVFKKTPLSLFSYYLLAGGVAFFGTFMSYTRYLLIAFPFYIAIAEIVQQKKYQLFFMPIIFLSIMLQTFFIILYSLNYWVA